MIDLIITALLVLGIVAVGASAAYIMWRIIVESSR